MALSSAVCFLALNLYSQSYIVLFGGEKIEAKEVTYHPAVLKKSYFTVDGQRYKGKDIAFYSTYDELNANIRMYTFLKRSIFLPVMETGSVNLFERNIHDSNPLSLNPVLFGEKTKLYYNKLEKPLMKANFDNLKKDIGENEESMRYLRQYLTSNILEYSLYAIAGAAAVYGVIALAGMSSGGESTYILPAFGVYFLGSAIAININRRVQPKKIKLAINTYNK